MQHYLQLTKLTLVKNLSEIGKVYETFLFKTNTTHLGQKLSEVDKMYETLLKTIKNYLGKKWSDVGKVY